MAGRRPLTKRQLAVAVLGTTCSIYDSRAEWYKRGGHAGTTKLRDICARATKLGFKEVDTNTHNTPDGSYVGGGEVLKDKDGNTLELRRSYGVTAHDNSYHAVLTFKVELT